MTLPPDDATGRTPAPQEDEPDTVGGRSWWPFGRRREAEPPEPRLEPAGPTGFSWLEAPEPPAPGGAETAPHAQAAEAGTAEAGTAEAGTAEAGTAEAGTAEGQADRAEVEPPVAAAQTAAAYVESEPPVSATEQQLAEAPPHVVEAPATGAGIAGRDEDGLLVLGGAPTSSAPIQRPDLPEAAVICPECGGSFGPDGYCENCGAKAVDPRHHYVVRVSGWLGGVCDRGVRHPGNQDALAIRGGEGPQGRRAAIVVCDGVSTAPHSAEASLRAAGAAAEVLTESRARGVAGVPSALAGALGRRLEAAADAAAEAVAEVARERAGVSDATAFAPTQGAPACTLVAAVVEDDLAVVGSVGDSRAYWLPDAGEPFALTTDDSWASEQIRAGVPRDEAENSPQAHTITRWLGSDSPDHAPALTSLTIESPGWLVVCSDGLWNYASDPAALRDVVQQAVAGVAHIGAARDVPEATVVAEALVAWAHGQGGHDNVTVGLARLTPSGVPSQPHPEEE